MLDGVNAEMIALLIDLASVAAPISSVDCAAKDRGVDKSSFLTDENRVIMLPLEQRRASTVQRPTLRSSCHPQSKNNNSNSHEERRLLL